MLAAGLSSKRNALTAFLGGAVIGALGGLIGLGGAEFRLPLLIGAFGFPALQAVILNKAMSLIVVASALPFRARSALSVTFGSARDGRQSWPRKLCIASMRNHAGVDRGHSVLGHHRAATPARL